MTTDEATGSTDPTTQPSEEALAEQLRVLVQTQWEQRQQHRWLTKREVLNVHFIRAHGVYDVFVKTARDFRMMALDHRVLRDGTLSWATTRRDMTRLSTPAAKAAAFQEARHQAQQLEEALLSATQMTRAAAQVLAAICAPHRTWDADIRLPDEDLLMAAQAAQAAAG
ncbi:MULTISPECIES: hypothetical protein [unclassified Modestobacter]|uniref:hypothetical protein n=1 Tax=unclassified Modestobacter TaxID=2643866 RepID=UPI0022AA9495|nr:MULTISPECIES: hypothetical protein [unclassified Modestobacter]MCZ2825988.1 hypothetical protein [Modestobacter sp. VKM Ac-2981]MCZ2852947.1 hypothetical protein [Modestobacter sp. VKM Ac-2982]